MTALVSRTRRWLRKMREWATRYLPAELVGSSCAVLSAYLAYEVTGGRPTAAIAAAASESVGFYGVIFGLEWRRQRRGAGPLRSRGADPARCPDAPGPLAARQPATRWGRLLAAVQVLRQLVTEFGPSEMLDSFLVRPFAMYLGPLVTGDVASGTMVGKLAADSIFYAIAIISYEFTRHRARLAQQATRLARSGARGYETVVLPRATADGGSIGV